MNTLDFLSTVGSNIWIYGGTFLVVLSLLVFVHEWGHYIVARLCGVRVEVFSIGFGRELFGFNDRNGTRWKLSLIPLGGYVKLFGDTDPASAKPADGEIVQSLSASERDVAFFAKPVSQRALIVVAGPAINFIFAFFLLTALFIFSGQPVTPPLAGAVVSGSSADRAGFRPHDRILTIQGKPVQDFEDIRRQMMVGLNQKMRFAVERDGQKIDLYATPDRVDVKDRFGFQHSTGMLGLLSPNHAIALSSIVAVDDVPLDDVASVRAALNLRMGRVLTIGVKGAGKSDLIVIQPMRADNPDLDRPDSPDSAYLFVSPKGVGEFITFNPPDAILHALDEIGVVTMGTLESLGQMVTGLRSPSELGGVIRIGALAGDMARQGFVAIVLFTALLSINLGLINLFPIPLLDGGHLVFYAVEAVLRRPVPERVQEYAFRFGMVFLISLMVYANLNDILQLVL